MNKARELLEKIRQTHFDDEIFPLIPKMDNDARKEYMLAKLEQMICVDYEAPSFENILQIFSKLEEMAGPGLKQLKDISPDDMPDWMKAIFEQQARKAPDILWTTVWDDPAGEEWHEGCPFFYSILLNQLTDDERLQIEWIKDYTQYLGCLEKGDLFPLEGLIPGMEREEEEDCDGWSPIDDFNFSPDSELEHFIATTPYQRVAASLAHAVLTITISEVALVSRKAEGELKTWCQECEDFLNTEVEIPYRHFKAAYLPPRQFIARAHTLMHTAELDYHLNEILKHVTKI